MSRLLRTHYGTMKLPKELRTGRFLELEKKDIQQLTQLVGLRTREETGLNNKSKLKQDRVKKKPLKARKEHSKNFSKKSKVNDRTARNHKREDDLSKSRLTKGKDKQGRRSQSNKNRNR